MLASDDCEASLARPTLGTGRDRVRRRARSERVRAAITARRTLQFFLLLFAGWVNRHQEAVIEYLREENRVLRELHGKKRLRFTDDQRRRLAVKGKALGRKALTDMTDSMAWGR